MRSKILFRSDRSNAAEAEFNTAATFFDIIRLRSNIANGDLIIGRYSTLPFYYELEQDTINLGARLINSYNSHSWIANFDYYDYIKEYTPESWTENEFPYCNYDGPLVLKGRTNSRKHQWSTHMFAQNRREAMDIASRLANDSLIGPQGIIYRKYEPLRIIDKDVIYGLPYSNEFRFFFLRDQLLCYGFYWDIAENKQLASINKDGIDFARHIAAIASEYVNFVCIDIAQKQNGDWTCIELNDAQQAGLSDCIAVDFYSNLKKSLEITELL